VKTTEPIHIREEIKNCIINNREEASAKIFEDMVLPAPTKNNILSSLLAGHHLLIMGPTGSGKTRLAMQIGNLLSQREGVRDCPLHCYSENTGCPWCDRLSVKETISIKAPERIVRIQGNSEITPEDIIGDLDPVAAMRYGMRSSRAFLPGKALRANHGILVLDFIDRMPEAPMNSLIQAMEGDMIFTSHFDDKIPLDLQIIGTGGTDALEILPITMTDHFDIIELGYIHDKQDEIKATVSQAIFREKDIAVTDVSDTVIEIVRRTRFHNEIKRGVSIRGGIRSLELLNTLPKLDHRSSANIDDLRCALVSSLPHRFELQDFVASIKTQEDVLEEILDEVLGVKEDLQESISKDGLFALAKEIATRTDLKKPLKYGFYDILLKRIHRFPDSELAKYHKRIYDSLYDEIDKGELDQELLEEIEFARKKRDRMRLYKKEMDEKALKIALESLEEIGVLAKQESGGYLLGQKGITCLLEMLFPYVMGKVKFSGYGKHSLGKKSQFGTGRIVGTRKYRLGDSYKNVSIKDSMREAIRNRRRKLTRDDIRINKKDIRSKLFIVLSIDLSGTMAELDKLWYAKETSGAVALSSLGYNDKVGVVSFSNLADNIVEITDNPYEIMSGVIDMELHENAFTNVGYGVRKAKEMLMRYRKSYAARHIILISDGDATAPEPAPDKFAIREALKAASKGITISTVCINQKTANPDLMQRIARIGKGRMYTIDQPENMISSVIDDVAQTRDFL